MVGSRRLRAWSLVVTSVLAAALVVGGQASARVGDRAPTPWPGGRWEPGPEFGYVSARDHRDGVRTVAWAAHELAGSNGVVGGVLLRRSGQGDRGLQPHELVPLREFPMSFVLIHGATMGADCWDRLIPLLDGE